MSLTDKLRSVSRGQNPEDFAPPAVRDQAKLQALEKEIAATERAVVSNSNDMSKVSSLLKNSVTIAHEDTCAALDRVMADAGRMMDRLNLAVADHKERLRQDGQRIAYQLEAALQALTHAVSWVEQHSPRLNDPQVDSATQPVTDSKLLLDQPKAEEPKAEPAKNGPKKAQDKTKETSLPSGS